MRKGSVLVTGGTKRIGKAICDVLRSRGWNVLVHSREADNPLCADFSDEEAPARLFRKACEMAPDLCAIVNNASEFSTASALDCASTERLTRVNFTVPTKLTTLLSIRLQEQRKTGAVVDLLDARILPETFEMTPYASSKFLLMAMMREQARVLAPSVRVNAVAPGPVLLPTAAENHEPGGSILLERRPSPNDVAEAVAFFLEAESVTGQILAVDAGQSLLSNDTQDKEVGNG